ncbi:MAG: Gfo/Idh/MocA family protein [Planctomycetota bacterium]
MTQTDYALSRRRFLEKSGQTAVAGAIIGAKASASTSQAARSDRKIKIGVVGGGFGASFQWHEHPNCIVHAVSDLRSKRRGKLMKVYNCDRSYESLEKLILDRDIEAVAVFTGAPDHVQHCTAVMKAGKHVISAVPAAMNLEEAEQLREVKETTDRKYMMAETSYYRYYTIAARDLYHQGKFGELFYSEVEYYHPLYEYMKHFWHYQGKRTWQHGYPPMLYVTHSSGFLVGVTKERLTEVSCLGWGDSQIPEYANRDNPYDNPFSSSSALYKTNKGHMCRCNVFWDGTEHGERAQWFGTKMTFYMPGSGGQPFKIQGKGTPQWEKIPNFWERLPAPLRHKSGHGGSHTFITHEFVSALVENREPVINVYEALAMTVPGIVAHQSSLKGGEQMKVPNFDRKT